MRLPTKELKRFLPGILISAVVITSVFTLLLISRDWDEDPEAVIIIHPEEVHANTPIVIDGRNSTNSDGDHQGLSYSWSIMERVESDHSWLEFSFPRPGNFTIVLRIEESTGRSDTETIFIEVLP